MSNLFFLFIYFYFLFLFIVFCLKTVVLSLIFTQSCSFLYSTGGGDGVANVTIHGTNFSTVSAAGHVDGLIDTLLLNNTCVTGAFAANGSTFWVASFANV
jgi:hypothetical protein